jgi:4'-phosphopantetheinyl transferase EntD
MRKRISRDASKSKLLCTLFPRSVVATELRGTGHIDTLLPQERRDVENVVLKRAQEFAGGRRCARLALELAGINEFPLLRGLGGSPLWPSGIVGSITHTRDFCAAAIARNKDLRSIGVDAERIGRLSEQIWSSIFAEGELDWLFSLRRIVEGPDLKDIRVRVPEQKS